MAFLEAAQLKRTDEEVRAATAALDLVAQDLWLLSDCRHRFGCRFDFLLDEIEGYAAMATAERLEYAKSWLHLFLQRN